MYRYRPLRRMTALALALILGAAAPGATSAGTSDGNHCIFPDGTDFNEIWGVSEAVVWFFCDEIGTGQDWRVGMGWGMEATFKKVPKSFVPAGATPVEDFLAKFAGIKVIVDPGTSGERTYTFTDTSKLLVNGSLVNGVTMGTMDPLNPGEHAVEAYWTMSGLHCDGFGKTLDFCLLPGDNLAISLGFQVVAGN